MFGCMIVQKILGGKKFLLLLLMNILFALGTKAQLLLSTNWDTVAVGNANIFGNQSLRRHLTLYRASDFQPGNSGLIKRIGWKNATHNGLLNLNGFYIRMGYTSDTAIQSNQFPNLSMVRLPSNLMVGPMANDSIFFLELTQPFEFDRNQNLLIEIGYLFRVSGVGITVRNSQNSGQSYTLSAGTTNASIGTPSNVQTGVVLDIEPQLSFDIAHQALLSPTIPFLPATKQPVGLRFKNEGSDTVNTIIFHYQLGNRPAVSDTFRALVPSDSVVDFFFADSLSIPVNGDSTLTVWHSLLNDSILDEATASDTLQLKVCSPWPSGTYVVGPAPSDFIDLESAFEKLNCNYAAGPITLALKPGTYAIGSLYYRTRYGNAVIRLEGLAGPDSVILLQQALVNSVDFPLLKLDSARNFTLKNLTLRRLGGSNQTGSFLEIINGWQVAVDHVVFSTNLSNTVGAIWANASQFLHVQNCVFDGMGAALKLDGAGSYPTLINNHFKRYRGMMVDASTQIGLTLKGNWFDDYSGTANPIPVIRMVNMQSITIDGNRWTGRLANRNVFLDNPQIAPNGKAVIVNNVVDGVFPIYPTTTYPQQYFLFTKPGPMDQFENVDILHNTIRYEATWGTSLASMGNYAGVITIWDDSTGVGNYQQVRILNNLFILKGFGVSLPAILLNHVGLANMATINHNNYHSTEPNSFFSLFYTNFPTSTSYSLSTWRQLGNDLNATTLDPIFFSTDIMRPFNPLLNNKGTPTAGVGTDFRGLNRDAIPDIGAFEFSSDSLQFQFVAPWDTISVDNRALTIRLSDTLLIDSIPNPALLFFRIIGQADFAVDSLPVRNGNDFTFVIDTAKLGGLSGGDSLEYFFAFKLRYNQYASWPRGVWMDSLGGNLVPETRFKYRIIPIAGTDYTVGTNGDFENLKEAAAFVKQAYFPAVCTFRLIDSVYAGPQNFPVIIDYSPYRLMGEKVIFRPDSGLSVRFEHAFTTQASTFFSFQSAKKFELSGFWPGDSIPRIQFKVLQTIQEAYAIRLDGNQEIGNQELSFEGLIFQGLATISQNNSAIATFGQSAGSFYREPANFDISIRSCVFKRWNLGITGTGHQFVIEGNLLGDVVPSNSILEGGISFTNAAAFQINKNTVFNVANLSTGNARLSRGITIYDGDGPHFITNNRVYDVKKTNELTGTAVGIHVSSAGVVHVVNNAVSGIEDGRIQPLGVPIGIFCDADTAHIYHNTVHLFGAIGTATGQSESVCVLVWAKIGYIRNNVLSNVCTSMPSATPKRHINLATDIHQQTSFANWKVDNNASFLANTPDHYYFRYDGMNGPMYPTIRSMRDNLGLLGFTPDSASVPQNTKTPADFISSDTLYPAAGSFSLLESRAVLLPGALAVNKDIRGLIRPAFGNLMPDLGAYEFFGQLINDSTPPMLDSFSLSDPPRACAPIMRTISLHITDATGVDSAIIMLTRPGATTTTIPLNLISGTVQQGLWQAIIPALPPNANRQVVAMLRDSLANQQFLPLLTLHDQRLAWLQQPQDTLIMVGDSLYRTAMAEAGGLGFSEILVRTNGDGNQLNWPFVLNDALQTAIEIANFSPTPKSTAGLKLKISGSLTFEYALPAVMVAPGATMTFLSGTNPAAGTQLVYNMGTNLPRQLLRPDFPYGLALVDTTSSEVLDALAINGFSFQSNQTPSYLDFTGAINTTAASIQRISANNQRNASQWVNSSTAYRSSVGAMNTGVASTGGSYSWYRLSDGQLISQLPQLTFVPTEGAYELIFESEGCTLRDTFIVTFHRNDLGISRVIRPTAGQALDSSGVFPEVVIVNQGLLAVNRQLRLSYGENTTTPYAMNRALTIASGDSLTIQFDSIYVPSRGGIVNFCVWLDSLSMDENRTNDSLCIQFNSTVTVKDLSLINFNGFPNPASDLFWLEVGESVMLEVLDALGRLMIRPQIIEAGRHAFQVADWPAGMYNFRIRNSRETRTFNLIVSR